MPAGLEPADLEPVMELTVTRAVAAPAARVWEVLVDLDRAAEVLSEVTSVERLDGGDGFAVGTRWRETRTIMGREATEEMAVTAIDPGRSYTVEADSRGAHYRSVFVVTPRGDDAAEVTMTFGAEPNGPLSRLLSMTLGRLFTGTTRKMLVRDLDDIAAAAEA